MNLKSLKIDDENLHHVRYRGTTFPEPGFAMVRYNKNDKLEYYDIRNQSFTISQFTELVKSVTPIESGDFDIQFG